MSIKQPNILEPFIDPVTQQEYSLLGFKSFDQEFCFFDKHKRPVNLTVWISFANHCYTRKKQHTDPDEAVIVVEERQGGEKEERVFDLERWTYSQGLHELIKNDLRSSHCLVGGSGEVVYHHERDPGAPLRTEAGWYICGRFNVMIHRRKMGLSIRSVHYRNNRPGNIRHISKKRFYNLISDFYSKNIDKIDT